MSKNNCNHCVALRQSAESIVKLEIKLKEIEKKDVMEFKEAFDFVAKQLKEDLDYYQAWQANIAVSFQDTLFQAGYQFPKLHKLSNDAAKKFIDLLIG